MNFWSWKICVLFTDATSSTMTRWLIACKCQFLKSIIKNASRLTSTPIKTQLHSKTDTLTKWSIVGFFAVWCHSMWPSTFKISLFGIYYWVCGYVRTPLNHSQCSIVPHLYVYACALVFCYHNSFSAITSSYDILGAFPGEITLLKQKSILSTQQNTNYIGRKNIYSL